VPEVLDAIERGYLSPSWADKLYRKLPAEEQRQKIAAVVERKNRERLRCCLVMGILKAHMESGTNDLHQLRADLASALS
jgi:hypothetical protein